MIPKIIHFCWYGGGAYSETIQKCIQSWETHLSGYEIRRWDESNTPFDSMPFLKILYRQKRWAFIADYMRLYALFKQGGIYFDTDVEVIKSFDGLLGEKAFIGFQTEIGVSKFPFNTAVIGCEPKNSFIELCLQETEKLQRMKYHPMAAPVVSTEVLMKKYGVDTYQNQRLADVMVLTKDYFYPFSWMEPFHESCLTPNTLAIHWWEDSWGNKKKNMAYYWRSFSRKVARTPLIWQSRLAYLFGNKKAFFQYNRD